MNRPSAPAARHCAGQAAPVCYGFRRMADP